MKNCEMILAGFGGQGILFTGKILAFAAMLKDKKLSWLPSYGPEMRGGTANCHVIIDDEPIGSPIVTRPNILVAMNKPSLDKRRICVYRYVSYRQKCGKRGRKRNLRECYRNGS